jgi:hypothetical protein
MTDITSMKRIEKDATSLLNPEDKEVLIKTVKSNE